MMTSFSLAIAGFSAVSTVLLLLAYAVFIRVPGKSALSVLSCAALCAALFLLQLSAFGLVVERFYA